MKRRQRRALYYLGTFFAVIVVYALAYEWGMATFEGKERGFFRSLLVVVETFTTTGYGEDAVWESPQMILLVISMMFTGVFFIFMALPLFVVPWIEDRLSTTPPTSVADLEDHVVICTYTDRSQTLVDELDVLDVDYVVVEPDRELATELFESGLSVVHGDPESVDDLAAANLQAARALVVDVDDETNASVVLAAGQLVEGDGVQVITFAENPDMADYHRYAGADTVFSPRQLIGESIATKVTTGLTSEVADAVEIADDFEIAELPVQAGSRIAGVTVEDSGIRERTGANIIGAWFRGEFVTPPSPSARIDERTILLVAGREHQLETLKEWTRSETRQNGRGAVVVGGYGEVGSTVKQSVAAAGFTCHAIDLEEKTGVDVVGDVTDADTLRAAGIDSASTVILTLSDDTLAVFATLVVRELSENVEVIARANERENVTKLYRAGADYVLALSTVSGRMLASTILNEDVISFDQQVEVVRVEAGRLAGQSLEESDIRARTSCTVIAVERDDEVLTDLPPSFTFQAGDSVIVAGPDSGINELTALTSE
ncbi:NAD-binding protein [Halobacteria archaeon HArc-gm2]|nr:NAD-binding protein [Halobacteria archaeon HArc-gm2]